MIKHEPGSASVGPTNSEGDSVASDVVSGKKHKRHPAFGAMKGTFTIAPGVDLTEPAFPEWADLIDEKYGKKS